LKIENLRIAFGGSIFKTILRNKDGAQRHPPIFNIHYSMISMGDMEEAQ